MKKKNKKILYLNFGFLSLLAVGGILLANNSLGVFDPVLGTNPSECNHGSVNHYEELPATPLANGHIEYWCCCDCHASFDHEPVAKDGDIIENTEGNPTDTGDGRCIPQLDVVIQDSLLIKEFEDKDDAPEGYQTSKEYLGMWTASNFIKLNEVMLAQYSEVRFAVKCVNGNYFEFMKSGEDYTNYAAHENVWREYRFVKEEVDDPSTGTFVKWIYRCYFDGLKEPWTSITLEYEDFLNDLEVRLGGNAQDKGIFHITELRGTLDPAYKPVVKTITFEESQTPLHTLGYDSLEGQYGEPYSFIVTPNEGVECLVEFNGVTVTPVVDNKYTIGVARENVVKITDVVLLADKPLANANYNEQSKTSTLSSSWHQKNVMSDCDLTGVDSFYFDVSFSKAGYVGIGLTGVIGDVSHKINNTDTYRVMFASTGNPNEYNVTLINGSTDFPGVTLLLENGNLSDVTFMYQDSSGSANVGTFSRVFSL